MNLDELTHQILPLLYDYPRGLDLLETLREEDLLSFYPRPIIESFLIQEKLAVYNPETEQFAITAFGIKIQERGGWLKHVSDLETEKLLNKKALRAAINSGFASVVSAVISLIALAITLLTVWLK